MGNAASARWQRIDDLTGGTGPHECIDTCFPRPGEEGIGRTVQGYIETSNVNIVEEMVNLIIAQRAYEIKSKSIQTSDEMLQNIANMKR